MKTTSPNVSLKDSPVLIWMVLKTWPGLIALIVVVSLAYFVSSLLAWIVCVLVFIPLMNSAATKLSKQR